MTTDIRIGKLKIKTFEEVVKEYLDEEYTYTPKMILRITDFLEVTQCPDENDGCDIKDTMCPNSAYRSGSITGMHNFFIKVMPILIRKLHPISTNDFQFSRIKPYLKEINELEYKGDIEQHHKRLLWLKFWCNRAVELYGDGAVIMFG